MSSLIPPALDIKSQPGYISAFASDYYTRAKADFQSFQINSLQNSFQNISLVQSHWVLLAAHQDYVAALSGDGQQSYLNVQCSISNNIASFSKNVSSQRAFNMKISNQLGIIRFDYGIEIFQMQYTPAGKLSNSSCQYVSVLAPTGLTNQSTFAYIRGSDQQVYLVIYEKKTNSVSFVNAQSAKIIGNQTIVFDQIIEASSDGEQGYIAVQNGSQIISLQLTVNKGQCNLTLYKTLDVIDKIYPQLQLIDDFIPYTKLIQYQLITLYNEEYIGFFSKYGSLSLVLYRIIDQVISIYSISNIPYRIYGDTFYTLYLFGQFGQQNSFYAAVSMDHLLKGTVGGKSSTVLSCWSNSSNWNVSVQYSKLSQQTAVSISLLNVNICDQTIQVNINYLNFDGLNPLSYQAPGKSTAQYNAVISTKNDQVSYDIVVFNQSGYDPQGYYTSQLYSSGMIVGATPCYLTGQFTLQLSDNILQMLPQPGPCVPDSPQVSAQILNCQRQMTVTSDISPFAAPTYETFFEPDKCSVLNSKVTAKISITEVSPSGFTVASSIQSVQVQSVALSCFEIDNYLSMQYQNNYFQLLLGKIQNKFQVPCDPTAVFIQLNVNFTADGLVQQIKSFQFEDLNQLSEIKYFDAIDLKSNVLAKQVNYSYEISMSDDQNIFLRDQIKSGNFLINLTEQQAAKCYQDQQNLQLFETDDGMQLLVNSAFNCSNQKMIDYSLISIQNENTICQFQYLINTTYFSNNCFLNGYLNITIDDNQFSDMLVINLQQRDSNYLTILLAIASIVLLTYAIFAVIFLQQFYKYSQDVKNKKTTSIDESNDEQQEFKEYQSDEPIDEVQNSNIFNCCKKKKLEMDENVYQEIMGTIPKPKVKK